MKKTSLILTALIAAILCWALVCSVAGDAVPAGEVLKRLSCYVIAFVVAGAFFRFDRKSAGAVLFTALCIWGLYESGVGAAQLAGWIPSKHDLFKVTGSFLNPGPYGGFLAMVTASCFGTLARKDSPRFLKVISAVTMLPCAVMMVISGSRASWLGLAVAIVVILTAQTTVFSRMRHKTLFWVLAGTLAIAAAIGAYSMKPESARCRLFLWRIDCLAIADNPVTGAGPGAEMGAYGQAQHDFFASDVRSEELVRNSDCPQFAFNEFLRFGMACGVPGLLLAVSIYVLSLIVMLRRRSFFTGAWIALGVFALFSFPFYRVWSGVFAASVLAEAASPESCDRKLCRGWCLAALVISAALAPAAISDVRTQKNIKTLLKSVNDLEHFSETVENVGDNSVLYSSAVLFYYGRSLYNDGKYEKASDILLRAEALSPDPQVRCLRSECLLRTGKFKEAEEELRYAHMTVPVRLNPMYYLIRLYAGLGMLDKAREVREYALTIPCDQSIPATLKVRNQILDLDL